MNPTQKHPRIQEIGGNGPAAPPPQATTEVTITTLLGVGVGFKCEPNGNQTLVITKIPEGSQILVPMDFGYAAGLRKQWDEELAKARTPQPGPEVEA